MPIARGGREHFDVAVQVGRAPLVDEHHVAAVGRRGPCRLDAGAAPPDHEHLRATMLGVEPPRPPRMLVEPSEPRNVTEELLVHRPELPRPDHRAVVEADRVKGPPKWSTAASRSRSNEPSTFCARTCALAHRLRTHAHVGCPVHLHQAVGARARTAEQPTASVVLEAAGEHPATPMRTALSRSCRPRTRRRRGPRRRTGRVESGRSARSAVPRTSSGGRRVRNGGFLRRGRRLGRRPVAAPSSAPRSCACRARRGTRARSRTGGTTIRAGLRRRCDGSTRSSSAGAGRATLAGVT